MRTDMSIKGKLLTGFGIAIFALAAVSGTALSILSGGSGQLETRLTQMKAVSDLGAASAAAVQRLAEGAAGSPLASASSVESGESRTLEQLKGSLTSDGEKALLLALSGKMASFAQARAKRPRW